jgi:hypothetical protein
MSAIGRPVSALKQALTSGVIEAKTYGFFARKAGVPLPVAGVRLVRETVLSRINPGTCCLVPVPGTDFQILARLSTLEGRRLTSFGVLDVELALLRRLLKPGDTFVDAGANVGVYSLAAAAAVGSTGRVIACEPAPSTMQLLRHSVALTRPIGLNCTRPHFRITTASPSSRRSSPGLPLAALHRSAEASAALSRCQSSRSTSW